MISMLRFLVDEPGAVLMVCEYAKAVTDFFQAMIIYNSLGYDNPVDE